VKREAPARKRPPRGQIELRQRLLPGVRQIGGILRDSHRQIAQRQLNPSSQMVLPDRDSVCAPAPITVARTVCAGNCTFISRRRGCSCRAVASSGPISEKQKGSAG
jgi:hypothetical protein